MCTLTHVLPRHQWQNELCDLSRIASSVIVTKHTADLVHSHQFPHERHVPIAAHKFHYLASNGMSIRAFQLVETMMAAIFVEAASGRGGKE